MCAGELVLCLWSWRTHPYGPLYGSAGGLSSGENLTLCQDKPAISREVCQGFPDTMGSVGPPFGHRFPLCCATGTVVAMGLPLVVRPSPRGDPWPRRETFAQREAGTAPGTSSLLVRRHPPGRPQGPRAGLPPAQAGASQRPERGADHLLVHHLPAQAGRGVADAVGAGRAGSRRLHSGAVVQAGPPVRGRRRWMRW